METNSFTSQNGHETNNSRHLHACMHDTVPTHSHTHTHNSTETKSQPSK